MSQVWFQRLCFAATVLALVVVVLGAYVRLSDAGLGCPDWPGCYGHVGVPDSTASVAAANAAYPDQPVAPAKGWKEMVHRYLAGTLGLVVFALAAVAWSRRGRPGAQWRLPLVIAGLIVVQALLGMWTVTWKLKPLIVMAHLLGGLTVLTLLWLQTLRSGNGLGRLRLPVSRGLRMLLGVGVVVLVGQIALGGWTSANYAALACNELPTCTLGEYWPEADFSAGFQPWHGIGPNYEFGSHLSYAAKVAIHLAHRAGAVVAALTLLALAGLLWREGAGRGGGIAAAILAALLLAQLSFGVSNVLFSLPLPVAVAHNAGAAALLLALVTIRFLARPRQAP